MSSFTRSLSEAPAPRQTEPAKRPTRLWVAAGRPEPKIHPGFRIADIPVRRPAVEQATTADRTAWSSPSVAQRQAAGRGTDPATGPATALGRDDAASYAAAPRPDRTGLPDKLKANVEALSGLSLDDVRVYRNSPKPAQLRALAYAQGTAIHLGPGQERHLPHEAWHVVQQKQGRVRPTLRLPGRAINTDSRLEREASFMGTKSNTSNYRAPENDKRRPAPNVVKVDNTMQLFGDILFANLLESDTESKQKSDDLIRILSKMPTIEEFLKDKHAIIYIKHIGSTLAQVNQVGDQVEIDIAPGFFEKASIGRIAGVLAHEFAVHPMGTEALRKMPWGQDKNQLQKEKKNIDARRSFGLGDTGDSITFKDENKRGHWDHVHMAASSTARYKFYRQTVYEMVSAMLDIISSEAAGEGSSASARSRITENDVVDAIFTYLSDIALKRATNDTTWQALIKPGQVAKHYKNIHDEWTGFISGKDKADELRSREPTRAPSSLDVLHELWGLIYPYIRSYVTTSSIDHKASHQRETRRGSYQALTDAQEKVLSARGLVLENGPVSRDLYGALTLERYGNEENRDLLLEEVKSKLDSLDKSKVNPEAVDDLRRMGNLTSPTQDELYIIGLTRNLKIRIITGNGRIIVANMSGKKTITLISVEKPLAGYRLAIEKSLTTGFGIDPSRESSEGPTTMLGEEGEEADPLLQKERD